MPGARRRERGADHLPDLRPRAVALEPGGPLRVGESLPNERELAIIGGGLEHRRDEDVVDVAPVVVEHADADLLLRVDAPERVRARVAGFAQVDERVVVDDYEGVAADVPFDPGHGLVLRRGLPLCEGAVEAVGVCGRAHGRHGDEHQHERGDERRGGAERRQPVPAGCGAPRAIAQGVGGEPDDDGGERYDGQEPVVEDRAAAGDEDHEERCHDGESERVGEAAVQQRADRDHERRGEGHGRVDAPPDAGGVPELAAGLEDAKVVGAVRVVADAAEQAGVHAALEIQQRSPREELADDQCVQRVQRGEAERASEPCDDAGAARAGIEPAAEEEQHAGDHQPDDLLVEQGEAEGEAADQRAACVEPPRHEEIGREQHPDDGDVVEQHLAAVQDLERRQGEDGAGRERGGDAAAGAPDDAEQQARGGGVQGEHQHAAGVDGRAPGVESAPELRPGGDGEPADGRMVVEVGVGGGDEARVPDDGPGLGHVQPLVVIEERGVEHVQRVGRGGESDHGDEREGAGGHADRVLGKRL